MRPRLFRPLFKLLKPTGSQLYHKFINNNKEILKKYFQESQEVKVTSYKALGDLGWHPVPEMVKQLSVDAIS